MMGTEGQRDNIRFLASVVTAMCLFILVPMMGWALNEFIRFARQTDSRLAVLEFNASKGERYTAEDAIEDFGVVSTRINDHEARLRFLENQQN